MKPWFETTCDGPLTRKHIFLSSWFTTPLGYTYVRYKPHFLPLRYRLGARSKNPWKQKLSKFPQVNNNNPMIGVPPFCVNDASSFISIAFPVKPHFVWLKFPSRITMAKNDSEPKVDQLSHSITAASPSKSLRSAKNIPTYPSFQWYPHSCWINPP